jgi:hypothetical protein
MSGDERTRELARARQTKCRYRKKYDLTQAKFDVDGDDVAEAMWLAVGVNIHPTNQDQLNRACSLIVKAFVCHVVTGRKNRLWQTGFKSRSHHDADEDPNE